MDKNTEKKLNGWLLRGDLNQSLMDELTELMTSRSRQDAFAEEELSDRFYRDLSFGTGGLRGKLGAGTNRMNIYTVGKTTQGLINYILENKLGTAVAIGYDSRINSDVFAKHAAEIVMGNGLEAFLYDTLMPAPALSFAVRYHQCAMGIMITASHNPCEYNGYKVYNSRGCQVTDNEANAILEEIEKLDIFGDVKSLTADTKDPGTLTMMSEDTKTTYYNAVMGESLGMSCKDLSVVYTPLNGAGLVPVTEILNRAEVGKVTLVPEQVPCDGNFPTCPYPNPEKKDALELGLALCRIVKPDLLLATDPDCDRVGIAVRHDEDYKLLSGNEVGVLLTDFICEARSADGAIKPMPNKPYMVRTIVTTKMADAICRKFGVKVISTLTGFKYIGETIGMHEDKGRESDYIFGFEESYGYLSGTYVRDKDAVNAVLLICQMASFYKRFGKTLVDRMEELYKEYGYSRNELLDFQFPGEKGMEEMSLIMDSFRQDQSPEFAGKKVLNVLDYLKGGELPPADVVEFSLEDDCGFTVRPSGTEPKLKIYLFGNGKTEKAVEEYLEKIQQELTGRIKAGNEPEDKRRQNG